MEVGSHGGEKEDQWGRWDKGVWKPLMRVLGVLDLQMC